MNELTLEKLDELIAEQKRTNELLAALLKLGEFEGRVKCLVL